MGCLFGSWAVVAFIVGLWALFKSLSTVGLGLSDIMFGLWVVMLGLWVVVLLLWLMVMVYQL